MRTFSLMKPYRAQRRRCCCLVGTFGATVVGAGRQRPPSADLCRRHARSERRCVALIDGRRCRAADSDRRDGSAINAGVAEDDAALDRYLAAAAAAHVPAVGCRWTRRRRSTRSTAWRDMVRAIVRAASARPSPSSKSCFENTAADLQRFAIEIAATEGAPRGSGVLVARAASIGGHASGWPAADRGPGAVSRSPGAR